VNEEDSERDRATHEEEEEEEEEEGLLEEEARLSSLPTQPV